MQPTLTQEAKDAILEELKSEDIQNHMSDDGHAALARAMEIVESFPVSDGWIPVTERLPEPWDSAIVHCGFSTAFELRFTPEGWVFPDGGNPTRAVTHWQPLPLLPPSSN